MFYFSLRNFLQKGSVHTPRDESKLSTSVISGVTLSKANRKSLPFVVPSRPLSESKKLITDTRALPV